MTFTITQPCIDTMDQSCVEVCPVDCIHFDEGVDRMLYIDPVECIDCGACQPACPVSAIFPEADVPADQRFFTELNALWYHDKDAARSRVPGAGGGAPAAPAEPVAAPVVAATAAESTASAAPAAEPAAPAAAAPAPVAAAAAPAPAPPVPPPPVTQVSAGGGSTYVRPGTSAVGVAALALLAVTYYVMWVFPGPKLLEIAGVRIGASVVLLVPIALIALLVVLLHEASMLGRFASHQARRIDAWRERNLRAMRRSEESRRHYQAAAVEAVAAQRFAFPSTTHPDYRAYVNVPEPLMAVEVGPGSEKLFADIVVTRQPGNYPAMVAMVETRETVTREQAENVWKRLENRAAPLYLYVPAGLAQEAGDYARSVDLQNYRLRTWRRVAGFGVKVSEP